MTTESYTQNLPFIKYPRTPHLQGSRLQAGDSEQGQLPFAQLAGQYIVVEEKLDGANCAISFSAGGELLLQSRGHYLMGGSREKQFNLFKHWAAAHEYWLLARLQDRYIMYGEWLHKKHSIFYDALPHYFCEFDIWDRQQQCFLSTAQRHALLANGPVLSVPVLYAGIAPAKQRDLLDLVTQSLAKSNAWENTFAHIIQREKLDLTKAWQQCDKSALMEGLYLKIESTNQTIGRLKWVRRDFVQTILDAGQHHAEQPFIPNQLANGVDIYSPTLSIDWNKSQKGDRL